MHTLPPAMICCCVPSRRTDPGEGSSEGVTAPRSGGDEGRELLTEGALGAIGGATEEAAGMNQEGDGATATGEIGDMTLVVAVDGRRGATTDYTDAEALAAIARITGGNFRLLQRLFTQIARLLKINQLATITAEVVQAAREGLVIGEV